MYVEKETKYSKDQFTVFKSIIFSESDYCMYTADKVTIFNPNFELGMAYGRVKDCNLENITKVQKYEDYGVQDSQADLNAISSKL